MYNTVKEGIRRDLAMLKNDLKFQEERIDENKRRLDHSISVAQETIEKICEYEQFLIENGMDLDEEEAE